MRIALAQTEPLWEDKEGNFKAALTFLERAREQKADLVLFPEMSMTGFSMHPEKIGEFVKGCCRCQNSARNIGHFAQNFRQFIVESEFQ